MCRLCRAFRSNFSSNLFATYINTPSNTTEFKCAIIQNQSYGGVQQKGVLRNFAKFTGKHLCQSFFFSGVRPATLLKIRLWHRCFSVSFAKFRRKPISTEHFRGLPLIIHNEYIRTTQMLLLWSVLTNQFVPPTFSLCFSFAGINFLGMLHHVCDVAMTKIGVGINQNS